MQPLQRPAKRLTRLLRHVVVQRHLDGSTKNIALALEILDGFDRNFLRSKQQAENNAIALPAHPTLRTQAGKKPATLLGNDVIPRRDDNRTRRKPHGISHGAKRLAIRHPADRIATVKGRIGAKTHWFCLSHPSSRGCSLPAPEGTERHGPGLPDRLGSQKQRYLPPPVE